MPFFDESSTLEGTALQLYSLAKEYGYKYASYGCLTGHVSIPGRNPAVLLNYPTEWVELYFHPDFQYYNIDPVVGWAKSTDYGFVDWSEFETDGDPETKSFMQAAAEHGLAFGFSVLLAGPVGSKFVITFCGPGSVSDENKFQLRLIAAAFHMAAIEHLKIEKPAIMGQVRPIDSAVLTALAIDGLTIEESARRLNISRPYVNKCIKKWKGLLGAKSLAQVVFLATVAGFLNHRF